MEAVKRVQSGFMRDFKCLILRNAWLNPYTIGTTFHDPNTCREKSYLIFISVLFFQV